MDPHYSTIACINLWVRRSSISAESDLLNASPLVSSCHIMAGGERWHLAGSDFVWGHFWKVTISPFTCYTALLFKNNH